MSSEKLRIVEQATGAYDDQKPGTSGLRKPVQTYLQKPNYTENFVQAILDSIESKQVLVCGGDGRYYSDKAIEIIVRLCAANGVRKLIIGHNGIFSTPAVSAIIRKLNADGGIILTASHNPGGPDGDFGIKFNSKNGGPATESVTNAIYQTSRSIKRYLHCPNVSIALNMIGERNFELENGKQFTVAVIDSIEIYLQLIKSIFNLEHIRDFLLTQQIQLLIDSLNGVMGPYARRVFVQEFGLSEDNVRNAVPLANFGGKHPDPNLTYAAELVEQMKTGKYAFGAAFDGDGDRNMILGQHGFFVTPSDSLALIAANLNLIPYFQQSKISGFARSMPTAPAVDQVAKQQNLKCFEVPTGWKFFGNLMDADLICLCGEESFGTGSNHIREKDGLWTVLCWLTILAEKTAQTGQVASVEGLIKAHWAQYGRNVFTRYDYENCESAGCNQMMASLEEKIASKSLIGRTFESDKYGGDEKLVYKINLMDNFEYVDPVDRSVTSKQGVRILFENGARIVVRLSGTGSQGATVRLYVDTYVQDNARIALSAAQTLKSLVNIALELIEISKYTSRNEPTVIT